MRTLTRTLALMVLAGIAHSDGPRSTSSLFTPCADVLRTAEFAALRGVISEDLQQSAGCLRLTNREFVLLNGAGILQPPFYHCDLRKPSASCEPEPFTPYSFEVLREFSGAHGKRFMLWKTSRYRMGVYTFGYGIASLVPKTADPRGFAIYGLASGRVFRGEDPDSADPCQDFGDEVNDVTSYALAGEGTADVELRFTEKVTNCRTKEPTERVRIYRLSNGKFELLAD